MGRRLPLDDARAATGDQIADLKSRVMAGSVVAFNRQLIELGLAPQAPMLTEDRPDSAELIAAFRSLSTA
jgi:hypothetical protein